MSIGNALQSARKIKGLSQKEVAAKIFVDRTHLNRIENGGRKASKDIMRSAATTFDDPQVYIAAMYEITGGAFCPWMDNIDLHHAAIAIRALAESREADEAIKAAPLYKRPEDLSAADRKMIDRMLKELRESIHAELLLMASTCRAFGFSWAGEWKEHNQLMESNMQ